MAMDRGRIHWGKMGVGVCLQIIVVCVMVPSTWMQTVVDTEHRWLADALGNDMAQWVRSSARASYDTAIVDTGVLDFTYRALLPTRAETAASGKAMAELGTNAVFPYVRDRLETLFLVIYQMFVRAVLVLAWLPLAASLLLPAVVDGLVQWRIRRTTFDWASPALNHYALLGVTGVTTLVLVGVFAPLPLPPMALPVATALLAWPLYLAVSHTSKRI